MTARRTSSTWVTHPVTPAVTSITPRLFMEQAGTTVHGYHRITTIPDMRPGVSTLITTHGAAGILV